MEIVKSIVALLHEYLEKTVQSEDVVVDATAGNGNDTLFLRELVGEKGHVYAFDIQREALDNTAALLRKKGCENRVTLLLENYKDMNMFVPFGVAAIIFNLGYLPKGNHHVVSTPEDTIKGITTGMDLLKSGGMLFVAAYWGHENGEKEKNAIEEMVKNPLYKGWGMYQISVPNREKAPCLFIMEKP